MIHELRGHKEQTPHHFPSMLYACAFSADGKFLATGDKVGHVVVWEIATGKQAGTRSRRRSCTPGTPSSAATRSAASARLAFSPDGKLLAVGGMGKVGNIDHLEGKARIEVFDWQKGERTIELHERQLQRPGQSPAVPSRRATGSSAPAAPAMVS